MKKLSIITALLPAFAFATPNAPSNLTFTNVTGNSVTINWSDNSDSEIAYKIYMNYTLIKTVPANSEKTTVTGLKADKFYNFTVVATDAYESRINLNLNFLYNEDGEKLSPYAHGGGIEVIIISSDENRAYIRSFNNLLIFDISDKSHIKLINSYTSKTGLRVVGLSNDEKKLYFVEGDFDYCSIDEGVKYVMDVSDPSNLSSQKITTIPKNDINGGLNKPKSKRTISKDGKIGYGQFGGDWETYGITIKDISDSNNPITIQKLDLKGNDSSIWIKFMTLTEDDNYLLVEGEGSNEESKDALYIIDVSNPSNPKIAAQLNDLEIKQPNKFGLSNDGTKFYAANLHGDITIVDISDISHPTVIKIMPADQDDNVDNWLPPENDIIFSQDNKKLYIGRHLDFEIVNL